MRATLKGLVESGLLHGGPATISRARYRRRALILAYHNVVPERSGGTGGQSLHLPLSAFRAQLAALEEWADVVPLDQLLSGDSPADAGRTRVAITFDDAYRGAVTLALPELAGRGMPATVFVSPGRLGGQTFWWDRFAEDAAAALAVDDFRESALTDFAGVDDRVGEWAAGHGWEGAQVPDLLRSADVDELDEAAAIRGVTLASHSWSHPNLTRLDEARLNEELVRPLEWLKRWGPSIRPWLAYPYGIGNERVAAAAADAGYEAAFRVDGGWLPRARPDHFQLPRLNVPAGLSEAGFRLRLAGLLADR